MQIEVKIDDKLKETKVVILTARMNEEIEELLKRLSDESPRIIAGFKDNTLKILNPQNILRVYCSNQKVYVVTEDGEYTVRLRLYEMEERLDKTKFIRISNSEIINLNKVKGFDLSFVGTICVTFLNGTDTYVSRRYVAKIKHALGI